MKHGKNNFDSIRLLAAIAVIFDHSHAITKVTEPSLLGNSVGGIAVKIFFVISGYLICTSWIVDPNSMRYLAKRALRIMPALIVIAVLSAFVVGPMFTDLSLGKYFSSRATYHYLYNIAMYPVYYLPGVFSHNAYPTAVNGSLWSLPVEFSMYLILPCVLFAGSIVNARWLLLACTFVLCAASLWLVRIHPLPQHFIFYGTDWTSGLDVAPYFLLGGLIRFMCWERHLDSMFALFLVACVAFIHIDSPVVDEVILYILLPYAVLSLATSAQRWLQNFGRFGDLSYGVYIYAFLVQQSVAHLTDNHLTAMQNALVTLPIVLVLAWLSWHLVEKRMLSLKPKARAAGIRERVGGNPSAGGYA